MDAYRPKQRITLSFAKRNGRKCIAAAYGGDDTLRQNLSREPGAIMTGDTAYLPAENFVLAEFFDRYVKMAFIDYSAIKETAPRKEEDIVTLYRYNLFGKNYELTVSVDSAMDKHGRRPVAVYVKLTKDGRAAGESVFPLSGNCPIEEDIGVEVSDKGFIIRIPYCDGHMFRIGYARFDYSEKYDDFILTEYREENINRLDTEQKLSLIHI